MPVKAPNIIIPTGYEDARRKAERKRKIAEAMMARGLATNPNMQSWTQVLGQIGSAWAGKRLDKKADKLDTETDEAIRADYADRVAKFQAATQDPNVDPRSVVEQFGSDQWLTEQVDPYKDAWASRLKERENIVKAGNTYSRVGGLEGKPLPNDPNAMVNVDAQGNWVPNMTRVLTSAAAGGNLEDPNQLFGYVGRDPAMQAPGSSAYPIQPPQPASSTNESDVVFGKMTPEEKQIVNNILQKYAGKGASVTSIVPQGVPYGNPTDPSMEGTRPPDGVSKDGKPYWIINGVPYDNPEGR